MKKNLAVAGLVRLALTVGGLALLSSPAFAAVVSQGTPTVGSVVTQRSGVETRVLPPALRSAFYQSLAKDAGADYDVNAKGCASLPKAKLTACFNRSGVRFSGADSLSLHLMGYGRGRALSPVESVKPVIEANRVSYAHGNVTAWWRVLPVGFEQGFTIARRPSGSGELTLALMASRSDVGTPTIRHSRLPLGGIQTSESGNPGNSLAWGKLRYGHLVVTDAKGRIVPATLKSEGDRILIVVNDVNTVYPLTVDPLVWLEQEVTANDGEAHDAFGNSVAIEGTTALIGAPDVNGWEGAVYAFTYSNGTWTQTQKFFANDGVPGDDATFGATISLDGTTALIGALGATINGNSNQGAAYVFTESNGTWSQQAKLVASDGATNNYFSQGLAIDGDTALVGAYGASVNGNSLQGKAYIFTESNGTWAQTQLLTASDGAAGDFFGRSVALSGSSALVGSPYSSVKGNQWQGAVYVFTDSEGTWTQTQKLAADDGAAYAIFGYTVAASGSKALISAISAVVNGTANVGAAYIFTQSGGTWAQTAKLTPSDGASGDGFGYAVALSGSGTTALVGSDRHTVNGNLNQGAAYQFSNSGGTWTQTAEFIASDGTTGDFYGSAVAVTNTTALVGAAFVTVHGNAVQGAGYFYGGSDLGLALSAPQTVGQGQQYTSQTIATNSSSAASPAVSATITVPAAASFVSATASQGSCSQASGVVTCDFGSIAGNAGMATASVTLKATGSAGTTIENTASVALATPALTASAPTEIGQSAACQPGYTEFSGHLDAGESFTSDPITVSEAGQKYVDLTSPASFGFFTITTTSYGTHTYVYPHAKQGHRWGAVGSYRVGVQAGPSAGGDYTLCVNLNPAQ